MSQDTYLARQPIVDGKHNLIGYELLFRSSSQASSADMDDSYRAGLSVLASTLVDMGTEWLLKGKLAFINMDHPMLMSEFVSLLPPDKIVIEIIETVTPNDELIARVEELKQAGFRFALDRFTPNTGRDKLLPLVSYVKLDTAELSRDKIAAIVRVLNKLPSARLIAEKVETQDAFNWCQQMGFHYFQGYYFAHPEHLMARVLSPGHATLLRLLDMVRKDADIRDIEAALKTDVALTFKLLRYINSAGFGLSCEVQSIRHAVSILGMKPLYRWLTLLLATAGTHPASPAQARTAITRGRLCELLGAHSMAKSDQDNLFITGVFSLLEAMLDTPMDEILDRLVISEDIAEALLHRGGLYGPILALAEACESQDPGRIEDLAFNLMLTPEQVTKDHLQALAWIEQIGLD
ncbi:EAL domain-containing protein [Parasulfuritortus cantonensis]|uniref:EAL domain-containing protein n=1 Tax=Parasulfuritortus cantonensis TaxID=2528202 RepID=A0A4R1B5L3_9PROT|nr:EAL domain-containing protein [Parasulfuritortus cantonensis]TCJ13434.1 EAL domain-containing protein [Parasulfuritortus cantonensis]